MPPHNLPASLVPFVPREAELGEIQAHLQEPACRLLSLLGPGGCGKTRLAIEAAATMLAESGLDPFGGGLYFVPLAPLHTTESVVSAIAEVLGFAFSTADESAPQAQPRQQLVEYLRCKRMLLILDNFEHLLSAADLVSDILRAAMHALSIFRGSFTRHAAEQVTGTSLLDLRALVDRSFLQRTPGGRYELHELLRQYSAAILDSCPDALQETLDRHCAFFASALQRWDADLQGPRQVPALEEMKADSENIRAAWDWAVAQGQVDHIEQAMEGFAWFQWWRGHYRQGETALQAAVESLEGHVERTTEAESLRVLAHALAWQSYSSRALGRSELAIQLQERGLALLERPEMSDVDTRAERALLLRNLAFTRLMSDSSQARHLLAQSLALYEELGNDWEMGETLAYLGSAARLQGAYGESDRFFSEYLGICQRLGDQVGIAWSLAFGAPVAIRQGRFEEAEHLARESVVVSKKLGYRETTGVALLSLGEALKSLARFTASRSVLQDSLEIFEDLGRRGWMAYAQTALASANLHLGQYQNARDHAEIGLSLAQGKGIRGRIGLALLLLGCVALAEQRYEEASEYLVESVATYRHTGHPDDIACATAVNAYAAIGLGQWVRAWETLSTALHAAADHAYTFAVLYGLPALGLLLARQGEVKRGVELYASASSYPLVSSSHWFTDVSGEPIKAAASELSAQDFVEVEERGRAIDPQAMLVELLDEL